MIDLENWLQGVQAQLDHDTDRCKLCHDSRKADLVWDFERITYIMDEQAWEHDRISLYVEIDAVEHKFSTMTM